MTFLVMTSSHWYWIQSPYVNFYDKLLIWFDIYNCILPFYLTFAQSTADIAILVATAPPAARPAAAIVATTAAASSANQVLILFPIKLFLLTSP